MKALTIVFSLLILLLSLRGLPGNPTVEELSSDKWVNNGPFELSPERGRFSLVYSLVEDKSFNFSLPLAHFTVPDLGYINGKYVSLFAPGVSFIGIIGYVIGKIFGVSQAGSFSVIAVFALLNLILIRKIAVSQMIPESAATIAGFVFLFATPAFAYGVTLYQHHISTFLILLSVYILLAKKNFFGFSLIWFLVGASVSVDYPNLIMMLPVAGYAIFQTVNARIFEDKLMVKLDIKKLTAGFAGVVPLLFFLWFNQMSYENPFQFSGTVSSVRAIGPKTALPTLPKYLNVEEQGNFELPDEQKKSAIAFFNTRDILNGLNVHLVSPDRGIIFFSPIILLGVLGAYFFYHSHPQTTALLTGITGFNLLLYSMWGDPWGGWAFGSRYLIPTYAILCIFLAAAIDKFGKMTIFRIIFIVLFVYSISVNTAGALSSNANPPQIKVASIEKLSQREEKYTFERNLDELRGGMSKSFVFQAFAKSVLNSWSYYQLILGMILIFGLGLTIKAFRERVA